VKTSIDYQCSDDTATQTLMAGIRFGVFVG
jgi:hypothetical protein